MAHDLVDVTPKTLAIDFFTASQAPPRLPTPIQLNTYFQIGASIPILRMLDEAIAREFYLEYLAFKVDWEHRFNDNQKSPLYMQISLGDATLHLNGHATRDSPACEVRIPVVDIQTFCKHLNDKQSHFEEQSVADPRHEGKPSDLNIMDPFQNHLVFWARDEL